MRFRLFSLFSVYLRLSTPRRFNPDYHLAKLGYTDTKTILVQKDPSAGLFEGGLLSWDRCPFVHALG
jgi:hypothetical protein